MKHGRRPSLFARALHGALVVIFAAAATLAFFLVLPLIQAITAQPQADLIVQSLDSPALPPPTMEQEPEPEPEPEKEEEPPELLEDVPPLDLAQIEVALSGAIGEGFLGGDFGIRLNSLTGASGDDVDALFSVADLDQEPRVVHRVAPVFTAELRKRAPATVYILFTVDARGRVENPIVQTSTDSTFDKAALAAVKQWKFEPGKRNGQPVRFRMRAPITFPKK